MAYPPRVFVENYWYHVYTRGQRQEPLFFSPDDRLHYLQYLTDELTRRGGVLGSLCLMTNHLHMLIKMEETPLHRIFQPTHMKYAKYFNHVHETTGHVFQGRPGMKIVLRDRYLGPLVGYIHRNPVEAGICDAVEEYRWSSWRKFLGMDVDWLEDEVWEFPPGFEGKNRVRRFQEVLTESIDESLWDDVHIGTSDEWERLEKRERGREGGKYRERRGRRSKEEIAGEVCRETSFEPEDLQGPGRSRPLSRVRREAMSRMYEEGYGPSEIGKFFNRTRSAVVHAYRRWQED